MKNIENKKNCQYSNTISIYSLLGDKQSNAAAWEGYFE